MRFDLYIRRCGAAGYGYAFSRFDRYSGRQGRRRKIVCKVNGDIITRGELRRCTPTLRRSCAKQGKSGEELAKDLKAAEADALRDRSINAAGCPRKELISRSTPRSLAASRRSGPEEVYHPIIPPVGV